MGGLVRRAGQGWQHRHLSSRLSLGAGDAGVEQQEDDAVDREVDAALGREEEVLPGLDGLAEGRSPQVAGHHRGAARVGAAVCAGGRRVLRARRAIG